MIIPNAFACPGSFSFRDDFNYASMNDLVAAGWTTFGCQCWDSVGGGVLYLSAPYPYSSAITWDKIPNGVSDWNVTLRTEWTGGQIGDLRLDVYTSSHAYTWMASGGSFILQRDASMGNNPVFSRSGYQPQMNVWHQLGLDMAVGKMSMYFDGNLIGTYTEQDPNTDLTKISTQVGSYTADSYDYITATQLNPAHFTVTTSPSFIAVLPGKSGNSTLLLTSYENFSGTVSLTATVSPTGPVVTIPSTTYLPDNGSSNSTLTVSTQDSTSKQTYSLSVTATSRNQSRSLSLPLYVGVRPAIVINGNSDFTTNNGVTGGTGTASNPYIISGWDIDLCLGGCALGIQIQNTNAYFVIRNVYIHDGGFGSLDVSFSNVTNGGIEGSTLANTYSGIRITSSSNIVVSGNNVTVPAWYLDPGVYDGPCLQVSSSSNITVSGNNFSDGVYAGIDLTGGSGDSSMLISNNNFEASVGIVLGTVANTTIANNRITTTDLGIHVPIGTSITQTVISGNIFSGKGISFQGQNTLLRSDTITTTNLVNAKPIYYFEGCSGTSIDGISVGEIIVVNCSDFQASNLGIDDVTEGIVMFSVHGASVTNVSVSAIWYGFLALDSDHVTISGNNVTAGFGIQFYNTSNMLVYHNNFLTGQEDTGMDYQGTNNLWDNGYPSGGNFWWNYPGVDNCSGPQQNICPGPDGIGDTRYGFDRYPLRKPYPVQTSDPQVQQTINFDGMTVSLSGSFTPDTTSRTVTGFLSVTVTNTATGQTVFSKTYSASVGYGSGSTARFVLTIATGTSWLGTACTVNVATNTAGCSIARDPDVNHDGVIDILDLSQAAIVFDSLKGDARYSASCDVNADGSVNILDLAQLAIDYQLPVFS